MFMENDDDEKIELRFKVLVVGEVSSGKTSFIQRYVEKKFNNSYFPTIGLDFALTTLDWDYSTTIKLQLWDISGQERCKNLNRIYYKNAVGAIIVFDLSCRKSFLAVIRWKRDLDDKVLLPNGKPIPCLLIGNKCDLEYDLNNLQFLDKFCKDYNFCGYFFTSAKESTNINESVSYLVEEILSDKKLVQCLTKKKSISNEIKIEKINYNLNSFCCGR